MSGNVVVSHLVSKEYDILVKVLTENLSDRNWGGFGQQIGVKVSRKLSGMISQKFFQKIIEFSKPIG
jgi:hypothetical protein